LGWFGLLQHLVLPQAEERLEGILSDKKACDKSLPREAWLIEKGDYSLCDETHGQQTVRTFTLCFTNLQQIHLEFELLDELVERWENDWMQRYC
jgi:hypothetical protein